MRWIYLDADGKPIRHNARYAYRLPGFEITGTLEWSPKHRRYILRPDDGYPVTVPFHWKGNRTVQAEKLTQHNAAPDTAEG